MGGNRRVQYAATLSGSLLSFASGINLGWSSPYLPNLDGVSRMKLSSVEVSWCAVMPLVGAPVGAILAAIFVDKMGRKNFLLTQGPIIALCFITMAYAQDVIVLSSARFIIGSTEGAIYTALPIYLGEIADPKIRGLLGSSISVAALIGTLFINIIGPYLSIYASSMICATIPLIHFVTFIWMPESPYYLLKVGDEFIARRSLKQLRGCEDNKEFEEIAAAVKRQESGKKVRFMDLFLVESNRKAIYIYLILAYSNKFSGINPVVFYTTTIFERAGGILDPVTSVLCFNLAGVCATIVAISVIDRFGRRPIMMFSAVGMCLALSCMAAYFTLAEYKSPVVSYLDWLPVTALLIYNVIFCFGLSFGPVLLLSELFPTSVKANALGLGDAASVVLGTLASQFFHIISEKMGMFVPFWCFAACTLVGFGLIYWKLPETKGKTLEEIQLELLGESQKIC